MTLEKAVRSSNAFRKNDELGNTLGIAVDHGRTPLLEYNGVQPAQGVVCLGNTVQTWVELVLSAE